MNLQIQDKVITDVADKFTAPDSFKVGKFDAEVILRYKKLALCRLLKPRRELSHYEVVVLDDDGGYPAPKWNGLRIFPELTIRCACRSWLHSLHKIPEHCRTLKNRTAINWTKGAQESENYRKPTFQRVD